MKRSLFLLVCTFFLVGSKLTSAQVNQDKLGAWYMYFFDAKFEDSRWGVQGDVQYRNWDLGGDLEQLLIRSGVTYRPKNANVKLTLGYGNITSGTYGDSNAKSSESRIYQEVLFPVKFGNRMYTNHRFRYEQRFVEGQDFRSRYRYNLFLNIPLNTTKIEEKTLYLSFYNELFINAQRNTGNGYTVEFFDRNRLYSAVGYVLREGMKIQLGVMKQRTNTWTKSQWQVSLHQNF
ncbi:DUF2490 domain-containing protein [Flavicella sediminum]|uniref:DUF2490 domain-containing protein n=1 Tax=Flavicella sediminum TaxID=2585141 RepID=UPI00112271B3|nr:DUF2490 domain-containing protein [Flavicella sediminum]